MELSMEMFIDVLSKLNSISDSLNLQIIHIKDRLSYEQAYRTLSELKGFVSAAESVADLLEDDNLYRTYIAVLDHYLNIVSASTLNMASLQATNHYYSEFYDDGEDPRR